MAKRIANYKKHLEMEEKLRESEEKYRLLFESAYDGIMLIDGMTIADCNQQTLDIFGCPRGEILGSKIDRFLPDQQQDGRDTRDILAAKSELAMQGEPRLFELELKRCDGKIFDAEMSLNKIKLQGKDMLQVMIRDITDRKQMEEWLRYLNMYDKPTGLYNRNYFEEEMQRMQTGRFDPVGIVVCDVDGLKLVNDNLGHDAGDALLAAAARILLECFRESDVVARIGGDEFAVLLPNCPERVVKSACKRIKDTVIKYRNYSPPVPISLSVGWAVKHDTARSMMDIFKEADNKMYHEKPANREKFRQVFAAMLSQLKEEENAES